MEEIISKDEDEVGWRIKMSGTPKVKDMKVDDSGLGMELVFSKASTFDRPSRNAPSGHSGAWTPVLALSPAMYVNMPDAAYREKLSLIACAVLALYVKCKQDLNKVCNKTLDLAHELRVYVHNSGVSPVEAHQTFIKSFTKKKVPKAQRCVHKVADDIKEQMESLGVGVLLYSDSSSSTLYAPALDKVLRSILSTGPKAEDARTAIKKEAAQFRETSRLEVSDGLLREKLVALCSSNSDAKREGIECLANYMRSFFWSGRAGDVPTYFHLMRQIVTSKVAIQDGDFLAENYYLPPAELLMTLLKAVSLDESFNRFFKETKAEAKAEKEEGAKTGSLFFYRTFVAFVERQNYFIKSAVLEKLVPDLGVALNQFFRLTTEAYRLADMAAFQYKAFVALSDAGMRSADICHAEHESFHAFEQQPLVDSSQDASSADGDLSLSRSSSMGSTGSESNAEAVTVCDEVDPALAVFYLQEGARGRTPDKKNIPKTMMSAVRTATLTPTAVNATWVTTTLRSFDPDNDIGAGVIAHRLPATVAIGHKALVTYRSDLPGRPAGVVEDRVATPTPEEVLSNLEFEQKKQLSHIEVRSAEFKARMAELRQMLLVIDAVAQSTSDIPGATERITAHKASVLLVLDQLMSAMIANNSRAVSKVSNLGKDFQPRSRAASPANTESQVITSGLNSLRTP